MPRKLKLTSGTSYDYTTIGIACHMKDYRFTFFLNDQLGFQMKRMEDLLYGDGKDSLGYSFYFFRNPEERRSFYLVSNYHEEGRLIPAEKGADFFLIVNDILPASRKKQLISQIQKIPQVLAAYDIPKGKANNLELIFEEIELHLL
ncbi:MAG: IPExxxVDY family protein [Bacteroidales bacterium]|nr:IPExxxVDY family protein [Bacteroidales bacterium]